MKIKNFSIVLLLLLFFLQTNSSYPSSNTAILNIHWGMNPKQVENATNKELEQEQNRTDIIFLSNLITGAIQYRSLD